MDGMLPQYSLNTREDRAIARLLELEGSAYVNRPGIEESKFGITKKTYPNEDIRTISRERAIEIYHSDWWLQIYEDIVDERIAILTFLLAVNRGPQTAHLILQQTYNEYIQCLQEDGKLGPKTAAALNAVYLDAFSGNGFLKFYQEFAEKKYRDLMKTGRYTEADLKSWLKRLEI